MAEKIALRKLQRGEDGKLNIVLVDATTGQQLTDATGYTLGEPNGSSSIPNMAVPKATGGSPTVPTPTAQPTAEGMAPRSPEEIAEDILLRTQSGGGESNITDSLSNEARTQANNFGYIDKPMLASLASNLPGLAGVGGKVVNGMINHNNVMAANAARKSMGLPEVTSMDIAKGTLGFGDLAKGKVADVVVNNQTYTVGLEALTEDGRTTLTPEEARKRSMTTGTPIREATPEEAKVNAEQAEKAKPQGLLGKAKSFLSDPVSKVVGLVENSISPMKETTKKGSGLASVSPTMQGKINGKDPNSFRGVNWGSVDPDSLKPEVRSLVEQTAASLDFGVNVTSGARSAARNSSVGGAKQSQHLSGNAVDISVVGLNDGQRTALVGTLNGLMEDGVGGLGAYSGNTGLHADMRKTNTVGYGGVHPMYDRSIKNLDRAPGWFKGGLQDLTTVDRVPTPVDREKALATPENQSVARSVINENVAKETDRQGFSKFGALDNLGPFGIDAMGLGGQTPAGAMARGLGPNVSDSDIQTMAHAFAGELSPKTLEGITARDPVAMAELANMTSATLNRGFSSRFNGDIPGVLNAPSQVNSLDSDKVGRTNGNYSVYGDDIASGIRDTLSGKNQPTAETYSHWENTANPPSWTGASTNSQRVGEHNFHSLMNEYSPSNKFTTGYESRVNDAFNKSLPTFDTTKGFSSMIDGGTSFSNTPSATGSRVNSISSNASNRVSSAFETTSSSGFAGKTGSARSVNSTNSSFDSAPSSKARADNSSSAASKGGRVTSSSDKVANDRVSSAFGVTSGSGMSLGQSMASKAASKGDNTRSSTSTSSSAASKSTGFSGGSATRSKDDNASGSGSNGRSNNADPGKSSSSSSSGSKSGSSSSSSGGGKSGGSSGKSK